MSATAEEATPTPINPAEPGGKLPRGRVSRRTVLGAAVGVGVGAAALRLLYLDHPLGQRSSTASNGRLDWTSPLGREQAQIAQLLRRSTFGASADQLETAYSDGFNKTVDRLIETPPEAPPALPGADAASRTSPLSLAALEQWWLSHMLATSTPFAERMTLFWHGHFTSDYRKVGLQSPFIYWQNLTWRKIGLTDLRSMLMQVTIDPAMLRYLDLGTSTGTSPNENYSRELMELFTMGPGHYTEDDVRAAAKALAGWRIPNPAGVIAGMFNAEVKAPAGYKAPAADDSMVGIFTPGRAYHGGPITFLGKTARFDTQAVLDQILAQSATAPFIATKALQHFLTPNPSSDTVKRIADRFRSSRYDMKTLMRDVFTSPEFLAGPTYRSLVKSPVELLVSALRALDAPQLVRTAMAQAQGMGQVLFDPPDVGGWPNNDAWISSSTVLARINLVTTFLSQLKGAVPVASDAHQTQLDGVLSPQTANLLNQATDDVTRWGIVLMSPEFQLK